ncbi:MAG: hypothetical protein HIU92_21400 [Proteobacteria bacterium]|nr:hypothetical protein [Pseudomonadota bacterium]
MEQPLRVLVDTTSSSIDLASDVSSSGRRIVAQGARFLSLRVLDCLIAIGLGALVAAFAMVRFYHLDFRVIANVFNVWFGGDTPRLVGESVAFASPMEYRTSVHPLAGLRSLPFLALHELGLTAQQVSAAFVGTSALVFTVVFYAAARGLGVTRIGTIAATALMLSTSAAMFWTVIPENFALGGATFLIPLVWMTAPRGADDVFYAPLQSILSMALMVTNWVGGLLAALLALGPRAMVWSGTIAFAAVAGLSVIQHFFFIHTGPFLGIGGERRFVSVHPRGLLDRISELWSQPFLAPVPIGRPDGLDEWVVAFAGHDLTSPLFLAALGGWVLLGILALVSLWRGAFAPKHLIFLVAILLFQVALFSIYGDGYFLYSLQILPFAVLLLAASLRDSYRTLGLIVMLATAGLSGWYNFGRLQAATAIFNQYEQKVLGPEVTPPATLSYRGHAGASDEGPVRIVMPAAPFAKVLDEQMQALTAAVKDPGPSGPISDQAARSHRLAALSYAAVAMAQGGYSEGARQAAAQIIRIAGPGASATMADLGVTLWALGKTSGALLDTAFDSSIKPALYAAAEGAMQAVASPSAQRIPTITGLPPTEMLTKDMQLYPDVRAEPTLFAEGFAWRGLLEAARFADRTGDSTASARWRQGAADAQREWRLDFRREALANPLTRATLFWPTGVAYRDRAIISQHLHFPLDYGVPDTAGIGIAQAHQFLRLGEPEAMWHRLAPVLTPSLEPVAGLLPGSAAAMWRDYQGLDVGRPDHPGLRARAELALLVLESLGFVDPGDNGPTVVIGGGLLPEWLDQPISVTGLRTTAGVVDWSWDGSGIVRVKTADPSVPVRLGAAFPPHVRIERLAAADRLDGVVDVK